MFNSPQNQLVEFKSKKLSGSEFGSFLKTIAVLKDEKTVIGVKRKSGEALVLYWLR